MKHRFIILPLLAAIALWALTGCAHESITLSAPPAPKAGEDGAPAKSEGGFTYTYSDHGWVETAKPHVGEAAAAYSATRLADAYASAIKDGTFTGPGTIIGMVHNDTSGVVYVRHPEADIEFPLNPDATVPLSVHRIPSFLRVRGEDESSYTKMTVNPKDGVFNGIPCRFGLNIVAR